MNNNITPDLDLVNMVKENRDECALMELVERHSGIYYKTVKKYAPTYRLNDTYDDFYRRKEAEIFKAVESYDENRGVKFSSWLANQTKFSCLSARSGQKNEPELVEYTPDIDAEGDDTPETDLMKKEMVKDALKILKNKCRDRVGRVVELKF